MILIIYTTRMKCTSIRSERIKLFEYSLIFFWLTVKSSNVTFYFQFPLSQSPYYLRKKYCILCKCWVYVNMEIFLLFEFNTIVKLFLISNKWFTIICTNIIRNKLSSNSDLKWKFYSQKCFPYYFKIIGENTVMKTFMFKEMWSSPFHFYEISYILWKLHNGSMSCLAIKLKTVINIKTWLSGLPCTPQSVALAYEHVENDSWRRIKGYLINNLICFYEY